MNIFYDGFWLDYWNEVLNILYSSLFKGVWWKDYGIPLLGSILIPTSVWYFGSVRAEEQKELKELRDNLNLLTSITMATLNSITFLYERIVKIQQDVKDATQNLKKGQLSLELPNIDRICYGFVFDNIYKDVHLNNYSSCVRYCKDFVYNLSIAKSLVTLTATYISERNKIIEDIANINDLSLMNNRYQNFIISEEYNIEKLLYDLCRIALLLQLIIEEIQVISAKNKKLKLIDAYISPEQYEFLNIATKTISNRDKIFNNEG